MRLGVYADLLYRRDAGGVSADRAFVGFVTGLAGGLEELVLFGRLDPEPGRHPYAVPPGVRFVPLPHYSSVAAGRAVAAAARESVRRFAAGLDGLDVVWLFGPHPLALAFAAAARRRRVPVVLGVRQDFPRYVAARASGPARPLAVAAGHGLETAWRLLARRLPAVVVGEELAHAYAGGAPVLATGLSLIREADVVSAETALARGWDGDLRLLTVGRLDPEKNPLLLVEILAGLRERHPRWRLAVAGDGPLAGEVAAAARAAGVDGALELLGYVPNGERLWREYGRSHAFLHVSLTEGLPQVLFEAQSLGLPIVATDVGGVRAALAGGETGLLVPPRDAGAAVAALERLRGDPALRRILVERGLEHARQETLEAQAERVLAFLRASSRARR